METIKLYYKDSYIKEFNGTVLACSPIKQGYAIVLNQSAFYPEGGGQPGDTGYIGETFIKDTHEKEGQILHYADSPIATGQTLPCKIDWERRFRLMQGHTGEHILSGIIQKRHGLDNVGFHMGSEAITIDINGMLGEEQLAELELAANKAIYENLPISARVMAGEALQALSYRSKLDLTGDVRIIDVPRYDTCACCGTHLKTTGEIGIIKILGHQKYKSGVRIFLLCGEDALLDYRRKNKDVSCLSAMLSAKQTELPAAAQWLLEENTLLRHRINLLNDKLFAMVAQRLPASVSGVCLFYEELNPDELRRLCNQLLARCETVLVLSGDKSSYKYALGCTSGDLKPRLTALNQALNGKGGGKGNLAQGSVFANREQICAFAATEGLQLMD